MKPDPLMLRSLVVGALCVAAGVLALETAAARASSARRARAALAAERARHEANHPTSLAAATGYWIWARELENERVRRAFALTDMIRRVGPAGWPGCPEHTVCTRYGMRMLAIGANGLAHYVANVPTSSDFQTAAEVRWEAPGLASLHRVKEFSCAHPGGTREPNDTLWLRFRADGGELSLGVATFDALVPFPAARPEGEPTRWIVFRRLTRRQFYENWLIRRCQAGPGVTCEPECFSIDLIN